MLLAPSHALVLAKTMPVVLLLRTPLCGAGGLLYKASSEMAAATDADLELLFGPMVFE
jgi:hypothetical protein